MFKNADELQAYLKEENIENVDVRFCDLPGVMQHFTVPASEIDQKVFEQGLAFDGSSVEGFATIDKSDMTLLPDTDSAYIDPFRKVKTLVMNFFVQDPLTAEPFSRDPRNVARKAQNYLKTTGIADTAYLAPEAEFYVFDDVRYENNGHTSFYSVDSESAGWNSARVEERGNLGYKVRQKGGYFPVAPADHYGDLRDYMVQLCQAAGLKIERSHHEVGAAGQAEINWRFDELLKSADNMMLFKYLSKNAGKELGKTVTFMPKPVFGDNGSGMHVHSSLWADGKPLFFDETNYGQLSDIARWYIGGLLKHGPALLAFTNPTINSYRRLVPGFEAPVNLVYSASNRSACIRIPLTGPDPRAKRIEFRCPDPSANPYLAFAAILLAGIDGIQNRIEPADPIDKDLYELPPEEHEQVAQVPASLGEALDALDKDRDFLLAGDVFTEDLIDIWIKMKRREISDMQQRPHPYEFELYYQI
ncbi:type I glutamate--ammonia ligase [Propionimicrobium lymphophilum]|uniref:Glutamine synthetase n=1 Tax=Propionimicrobium lymphophilum ACS-093-V-SCH5 TaxID=883161 RepID=S2W1X2_9ACTN|nr:type I glutamate--ammonia ligase [Propionimicrobium lymphophilum]EPD33141.1 glutamine synthetase, type I [Propionimicrobium lymphophilum ACS-093-V-SCH5]MDK7709927.1 type I glutamate--ammonia ligase [Propionimicrobium lymphophilum]MDK7732824.1 type I glutamate--ammonia ligase [Propionimicrobium lymphophilum]